MSFIYNSTWRFFLIFTTLIFVALCILFLWLGVGLLFGVGLFALTTAGPILSSVLVLLGPFSILFIGTRLRSSLLDEKLIIETYGEEEALWVTVGLPGLGHPAKALFKEMLWYGHDESGVWLEAWAATLNLPQELQDMIGRGAAQFGSILWSRIVLFLVNSMSEVPSFMLTVTSFGLLLSRSSTFGLSAIQRPWVWWCFGFSVLWHIPGDVAFKWVGKCLVGAVRSIVFFRDNRVDFAEWLKWRFTALVVQLVSSIESVNSEFRRHHSLSLARGSTRLVAHSRALMMQAAVVVNDLALPNFVRQRFSLKPTIATLDHSLSIMKDLGWPINVGMSEPEPIAESMGFKEWVLCGSDFKQGIHNLKVFVDHDLDALRLKAVEYKRSETYSTEENELLATARYFKSPRYDFPEISLDDVWLLVGDIFRNSRLTPFNYIIRMWEKKYGLGAFMRSVRNTRAKYKRSDFIKDVGGYGPFKKIWANTFLWATQIIPVSAVSVKGEALPPRKWMADKVRTVIGSPISQYILSTIWNYGPNHKFAWESTPIKIGMPLNGYWMSTIWHRHSRCQIHIEGDMSDFDSTVSSTVQDYIRSVRKRGFDLHKDRHRIAELIDVNYDFVERQLLNTTSNGNVYLKGTGLTTGHSSTSMDNSVALVLLYLMAWKDVTGLSAKEFLQFNELSCFGDDHILSILATRPAVWTPKNIASSMARWGVTNNLDIKKSLYDCTFLAKHGRKATVEEQSLLAKLKVPSNFVVWHDKEKLIGKLTAKVRSLNPTYRAKRLLSYLTLTAHHPDIYDGIVKVLHSSKALTQVISHNKLNVPTYEGVLKSWYSPSPGPRVYDELDTEIAEFEQTGAQVSYGSVTALDAIVGGLSMLPDFLSPLLFNFGYMRGVQAVFKLQLNWIVDLIALNNNVQGVGVLSALLRKTPYKFLDASMFYVGLSGANSTTLLVRHWLFCFFHQYRPKFSVPAFLNLWVRKMSSIQFVINGRLNSESKDNDLQLDLMLFAVALSFISVPDWFPFLDKLLLPDFQILLDLAWHYVLVVIWQSVPPNFKEVTNMVRSLDPTRGPIGIQAPTGTGKSTSFINHLVLTCGHRYHKIVVIEPRTLLVQGLVTYLSTHYGLSVSGATSGMQLDKEKKVVFVTPQSLLGNLELLDANNLIVLDEAHLNEPYYVLFRQVLMRVKLPTLFVSATLGKVLEEQCQFVANIPLVSLWSIEDVKIFNEVPNSVASGLSAYGKFCAEEAEKTPPGSRALIFMPTKVACERAANACGVPAVALHSDSMPNIHKSIRVIFSTPVADVGLTLPDVDKVVTSTFSTFDRSNQLLKLDDLTLTQRRGRTGRTSNGMFVVYDMPNVPFSSDTGVGLDANTLRDMVFDGLPFKMAQFVSKELVRSAMGLQTSHMSTDELETVDRGIEVFLNNLRPVILSMTAAQMSSDPSFGPPVVLHHTGAGGISSSYIQSREKLKEKSVDLLAEMISAHFAHRTVPSNFAAMADLANIAGPILKIQNLVQSFAMNGVDVATDMLNPKNSSPTGSLKDVFALKDIYSLLKELEDAH